MKQRIEDAYEEAKQILRQKRLPVPRAKLKIRWGYASYVVDNKAINITRLESFWAWLGYDHLVATVLHEFFHVLVMNYAPIRKQKTAFATLEEWKDGSFRTLNNEDDYVTAYAKTNPEEDFVETATAYILGDVSIGTVSSSILRAKLQAVNAWFTKLRKRKRR